MGNWSKLKADEKIRVIKFARLNGVSDINTIRDTYNLYSNGGDLAHKHDGNSDTQYLRTEQPEVVMPVTGKTADTSWYEWWFANRQKQLHQNIETVKKNDRERDFTKYFIVYPNAEEDTKRMIKALGETKEYVGNAGMMEDSIGNSLARNVLASDIADYTPNISDDNVNLYLSYIQNGVHLPAYNSILYPGRESPSKMTVTHERAHAADAFFPRKTINYFTTAGEVNPEKYDTWYKRIFAPLHPKHPLGIYPSSGKRDSYLDNPNEVYSRLMEFRQFVGANPNYTWTKDDLKKYEPALNKFELRRYSDNDILKLLNEIAQNNSGFQKSENTYLAALGGLLSNKKSTGGPLYPFSFEKKSFLKTPVVRYDEGGEITNINLPEFTVMPRDSFVTYTGEETIAPTLELFIKSKQDEARVLAGHKMLDTTMPLVPIIPSQSKISKILGKVGVSDENRIKLFGTWDSPETCIYTATGLYPEENRVSGTKTFASKYRDYGFVPVENGLFGDIGLFDGHGTMITGFNHKRLPILSYSRGGLDASHILIDNDNWDNPQGNHYLGSLGPMTSYRFVGTPELQKGWVNLYNTLYSK